MKQSEFFSFLLPLARKAGEAFRINPAVILAQAAIESGWGQSDLASEHHNYFGLTAYGRSNVWWKGASIELGARLRRYPAGPPSIPTQHLPRYGKRGPSRTVLSSYFNPAQSRKRRFPQAFQIGRASGRERV